MKQRSRWAPTVLLVTMVAAGCRTPPNVGPFVDASSALSVVVASVGTQLEAQFADAGQRAQFKDDWARRVKAMQALADYASGLAQVVEAGRTGNDAAAIVLDDAKKMLNTVGAAFPPTSAATGVVADAVARAFGLFTDDRAAESVAKAIENATPAVNELANALAADFTVLEQSVTDWQQGAVNDIKARNEGLKLINSLREQATSKRTAAATATTSGAREAMTQEAAQFDNLLRQETAADWYVTMTADLQRVQDAATARRAVLRSAAAATLAWNAAHADLARASRTGKTPNYVVLVHFTQDLLHAYEEAKKP